MLTLAIGLGLVVTALPLGIFAWSLRSAKGTADAVRKRQSAPALVEELPYWSIEDDAGSAGSAPSTRQPMRSPKNRTSQRPYAPWLPITPTTAAVIAESAPAASRSPSRSGEG